MNLKELYLELKESGTHQINSTGKKQLQQDSIKKTKIERPYEVIVYYEASNQFDVYATNREEAEQKAEEMMEDLIKNNRSAIEFYYDRTKTYTEYPDD